MVSCDKHKGRFTIDAFLYTKSIREYEYEWNGRENVSEEATSCQFYTNIWRFIICKFYDYFIL